MNKIIQGTSGELVTAMCFDTCFKTKNMQVDMDCVQTCYQKYLFAINYIREVVEKEGRSLKSDFVINAVGEKPIDRFENEVFPLGGHTNQQREQSSPFRRKFVESYFYSDPAKTGR